MAKIIALMFCTLPDIPYVRVINNQKGGFL